MRSPTPSRAVAVVAHPDDESWLLGGTLARWSADGADVHVVVATAGDAGVDRRGPGHDQPLAELRRAELAAACDVLGVGHTVVGLPDGRVPEHEAELARELLAILKLHQPDVVLTHGLDGDYGHVDHLSVALVVRRVAPDAWCAALPPGRLHAVWRACRNAGFGGVAKGLHARDFGTDGDVAIELGPHWETKRRALRCHASQVPDGDLSRFLGRGLMDEEWTRTERWARGGTGRDLP